jgi:hypothetical protein
MRCPKCKTEVEPLALACPQCRTDTPRGKRLKGEVEEEPLGLRERTDSVFASVGIKRSRLGGYKASIWHVVGFALVAGPILGVASYFGTLWYFSSGMAVADPSRVTAIVLVRDAPSGRSGMSVGQYVDSLVAPRMASQEIVEQEGWSSRRDPDSGRLVVRFGYEDQEGSYAAQWSVDPASRRITPLDDWARSLYPGR